MGESEDLGNEETTASALPDKSPTGGSGDDESIPATTHGAQRIAEQGWTTEQYWNVINHASAMYTQGTDLSIVYAKVVGRNRYNVVIQGERGVITSFKSLTRQDLDNLANNYGWFPYP